LTKYIKFSMNLKTEVSKDRRVSIFQFLDYYIFQYFNIKIIFMLKKI
jgi:hypothetical protein